MKNFLLGMLFIISFGLGIFVSDSDSNPYVVMPNLQKIGTVKTADHPVNNPIIKLLDEKGRGFCTAFVFDANYAITAAHCLNDSGKLKKGKLGVMNDEGVNTGVEAYAAGMASRSDLGLVKGNFKNFKLLRIVSDHFGFMSKGPFFTCGFPYGSKEVSCVPFIPSTNAGFAIVGNGYLVPGQSGGPVIDLGTEKVVGLNSYAADGVVGVYPIYGALAAFGIE